jgi:hypothetical protein
MTAPVLKEPEGLRCLHGILRCLLVPSILLRAFPVKFLSLMMSVTHLLMSRIKVRTSQGQVQDSVPAGVSSRGRQRTMSRAMRDCVLVRWDSVPEDVDVIYQYGRYGASTISLRMRLRSIKQD